MAAPRKTQPVNTDNGDTTPLTNEPTPEQTPAPAAPVEQAAVVETIDGEQHTGELPVSAIIDKPSNTEQVTLAKEVGGHHRGATITVTPGAAEYLREQGYVEDDED